MQDQDGQKRARATTGEVYATVPVEKLHRPQDPELHSHASFRRARPTGAGRDERLRTRVSESLAPPHIISTTNTTREREGGEGALPLFMDVHERLPEGTTARDLAELHRKGVEVHQHQ